MGAIAKQRKKFESCSLCYYNRVNVVNHTNDHVFRSKQNQVTRSREIPCSCNEERTCLDDTCLFFVPLRDRDHNGIPLPPEEREQEDVA